MSNLGLSQPGQETGVTYNRVMLKISGEALMGDQGFGLHPPTVQRIAQEVKSVRDMGVEICMVIGGGNIFRGLAYIHLLDCLSGLQPPKPSPPRTLPSHDKVVRHKKRLARCKYFLSS